MCTFVEMLKSKAFHYLSEKIDHVSQVNRKKRPQLRTNIDRSQQNFRLLSTNLVNMKMCVLKKDCALICLKFHASMKWRSNSIRKILNFISFHV